MAEKTVYDTVRDITSPFEFTAFKNMTWLNDTSDNLSNRNSDNNYYSYLGGNEGDTGFDIHYTVDGKNVSGNFNTPVIKITETQVGDGAEKITKYSCENFMPGRRWVTVKAAYDDTIVGNRNIRLIPTTYLEAGVDSQIQVLSSGSDSNNIYNVVTYNNQGVWIDKDFDGKYDNGESTVEGVSVTLYKGDTEVKSVVTENDGSYSFDDIYSSDDNYSGYYTKFSCPSNTVTIIDSDGKEEEMNFNDLFISRTLSQFYVDGKVGSRNVAVKDSSETENNCYLITDQQLPNAEEVYKGNFNRMYYGMVNNYYYYSKPNQNLALARQNYNTIKTSLKIHKVDADTDKPLEGVGFMLEYRESEDYSYSAIYCKFDDATGEYKYALSTDDGAEQATNVTTNAKGDIQFTDLPVGQYRITEVKALDGYNLIPSSVEFNLPYIIEEGDTDGAVTGNDEDPQDGVYYDITYTVKNAKLPSLPLTGVVNNNFMFVALALGLLAVSVVLTLIYRRKYGKRQQG